MKKILLHAVVLARQTVEKNIGFILCMFVFNYFTIVWSNYHMYQFSQMPVVLLDGVFLLVGVICYTMLLGAIPLERLRQAFFLLSFAICALLGIMEIFAIYNYQSLVGAGIITALLQTNPHEAREFLEMYVGWKGFCGLVVLAGVLLGIQRYLFDGHIPFLRPRWQVRLLALLCAAGAVAGGTIWYAYFPFVVNNALDIPALRVYNAAQTAVQNIGAYNNLDQQMEASVEITENRSDVPQVVFILGEATNRNRMHLYGYALENTPNLDAMQQKGEIAVFKDCISPHAITVASLRELFTFHDAESDQAWFHYNNLMDVMRAAGYKTHWLSNQESSGIWGNVALLFAKRSQVHSFTRMRESHEDVGAYDEELFPLADQAIQQAGMKNFYVFHLMGGHSLYYMRFPYIFAKFSKDDIPEGRSDEQRTEIAQYANAIYYNDYIVSGLIDKFRDTEALVIYLPDHGETVYDDSSNFAGHVEENPNHYTLEVPLIIWASEKYKAKYPEKWAAIQAAVNRPYMTDDIIHTILDLTNIRTREYDPAKSLVNPAFDASRCRMVQGKDYDTEIKDVPAR